MLKLLLILLILKIFIKILKKLLTTLLLYVIIQINKQFYNIMKVFKENVSKFSYEQFLQSK